MDLPRVSLTGPEKPNLTGNKEGHLKLHAATFVLSFYNDSEGDLS